MQVCGSVDLAEHGKIHSASPAAILDALTHFRTQVRACAKSHKLKQVLEECDRFVVPFVCPLQTTPPPPFPAAV